MSGVGKREGGGCRQSAGWGGAQFAPCERCGEVAGWRPAGVVGTGRVFGGAAEVAWSFASLAAMSRAIGLPKRIQEPILEH